MKLFDMRSRKIWFPENPDECKGWQPTVVWHALAHKVLIVAQTRIEYAWRAYIDAVPGERHEREVGEVLRQGTTVPHAWAIAIFPEFKDLPYAR